MLPAALPIRHGSKERTAEDTSSPSELITATFLGSKSKPGGKGKPKFTVSRFKPVARPMRVISTSNWEAEAGSNAEAHVLLDKSKNGTLVKRKPLRVIFAFLILISGITFPKEGY
jgi:hypothetical protein